MEKFKVTKERFLNWYFGDPESRINFGNNAIEELESFGKVTVTIQGLFDTCGYIPQWICEDQSIHDDDDLDVCQVELI